MPDICYRFIREKVQVVAHQMARTKPARKQQHKPKSPAAAKHAAIFRNGSNQAVRLPQELRFADDVKEVRIRKQGDALLISPVKPDWNSFFAIDVDIPDDFLTARGDTPPQRRTSL